MAEVKANGGSGIGFCGLLTILFIGLKLTGYIAWSWWLVLLPMYLGLALILGIAGVIGLVATLVGTLAWFWKKLTTKAKQQA